MADEQKMGRRMSAAGFWPRAERSPDSESKALARGVEAQVAGLVGERLDAVAQVSAGGIRRLERGERPE